MDVWDAGTEKRVSSLEGHTGIVNDLAFDPAGERVATAGADGSVRVWDPRTGSSRWRSGSDRLWARRELRSALTAGAWSRPGQTAPPGSGPSTSTS